MQLVRTAEYLAVAALLVSLFAATVSAQDGSEVRADEDILEIDTRLVEVPVVVTDLAGRPVLGLTRENFEILEDDRPEEIASFSSTDAPFEVALFLDTSGSTRADLQLIVKAAEYFIRSLRPGDRVAIVSFNQKVSGRHVEAYSEIVSDLSEDREGLVKSLSQIRTSSGTPFYDGMLMVARDIFGNAPEARFQGRRAMVALTDGVDSTSFWDFVKARRELDKAGIISYFIKIDTREKFEQNLLGDCSTATHFSESQIKKYWAQFPKDAKMERVFDFCKIGDFSRLDMSRSLYRIAFEEMSALSSASGGKVFAASDIRDAATAFGQVAEEIGSKYSIGYYSSNEKTDGAFRKITVKLRGIAKETQVRAREGYKAPSGK
ncbi:MAG: VWA domain-containing protein [Acidobacteria bacterium]|nr:MAG: VWA domain-containing protein [Acidobacteriota bacterium]REK02025.1 MAG: VWA domain-containing protein [Acidobacteriota bacterium]REK14983.1 MAG: VWA domain-containing protein [Acidobacteriota bacterium]REK45697.1 MAG: VWA domain-containing protein [Acidobacteriota bacterium]